jgi:hypothetical protein
VTASHPAAGLALTVLFATLTWFAGYLVFAGALGVAAVAAVDLLVAADAATRATVVAIAVGLGMVGCTALAVLVTRRRGHAQPWWLLTLPVLLGLWGVVEAQADPAQPAWAAVLALVLATAGSVAVIARRSPPSGRSPRSASRRPASRRSG